MVNLADLARESGHGGGLEVLSRQFGLDPGQTSKAVEVLLPAFTLAFQRLVLNPTAFADFARAVTSGSYASFFDNPARSDAASTGAAIVEQLFRSPEAAKQVAAQASALTGVGVQVMQQMLPVLAATIVGGMFRYATAEGFAELLRQWSDALKLASDKLDPPKPKDPWSVWQKAAGQMIGLRPAPPPPPKRTIPEPASVLDAWVALVGAMTGMSAAPTAPAPVPASHAAPTAEPSSAPPHEPFSRAEFDGPHGAGEGTGSVPPAANPDRSSGTAATRKHGEEQNPFEAMSQMFETGREMHAQHVAAFQSILDNVWGTGRA